MPPTIDWKKINPEFSGEVWLAINSGKTDCLKEAKKWGRSKTRETDKQFDGFVQLESLDELLPVRGSTLLEVLDVDDLEPSWLKRCGLGIYAEDNKESMLGRLSMASLEMIGLLGESCETLFEQGVGGKSKSAGHKALCKLIGEVEQAVENGAFDDEISEIIECRLAPYFPHVVKKHAALEPARWTQMDLFEEIETV